MLSIDAVGGFDRALELSLIKEGKKNLLPLGC